MERNDLFEDDLTEERYPTPAQRDDAAATERLDPDTLGDGSTGEPAIPPDDDAK